MKEKLKKLVSSIFAILTLHPIILFAGLLSMGFGAANILFSIFNSSFTVGITGVCAFIFGTTKLWALKKYSVTLGLNDETAINKIEKNTVKRITVCSLVVTFLYCGLYVVSAYFYEVDPESYDLQYIYFISQWAIITITIAVINLIRTKKKQKVILHHIKLIDNANALMTLALAQKAILYHAGFAQARNGSGIAGMFFSISAFIICLVMFHRYKKNKKSYKAVSMKRWSLILGIAFMVLAAVAIFFFGAGRNIGGIVPYIIGTVLFLAGVVAFVIDDRVTDGREKLLEVNPQHEDISL